MVHCILYTVPGNPEMMNSAALTEGVQLIGARSAQVEVNLNKEWTVAVRFNLTEKTGFRF